MVMIDENIAHEKNGYCGVCIQFSITFRQPFVKKNEYE
jgi:hypothetical protein